MPYVIADHASLSPPRPIVPAIGPGVVLGGKYRLEATIAHGGAAEVWRAVHVTLNQPVAVKFLDGVHATRTDTFLREAKVAASVRNSHVVDIIDFGILETASHEPEPYMVMALLDGEALDTRMERGRIHDETAVSIGLQALSGLEAVHRASIVHRDIKPGNIFVTDEDDDGVLVRLLDFGISTHVDATNEDRSVVGTPEYMSPEQALGAAVDLRSDLYSLGVVLYEMLSGVLPFEHDDPRQLVALVAAANVMPLGELRPDIPGIAEVIDRAMRRAPEARWTSARAMRHALLQTTGRGREVSGRHPSSPASVPPLAQPETTAIVDAPPLGAEPEPRAVAIRSGAPRVVLALSLVLLTAAALVWAASDVDHETAAASAAVPHVAPRPEVVARAPIVPEEPRALPTLAPVPTLAPIEPVAPPLEAPEVHVRARRRARVAPAPRAPVLHRELDF